jgi:guanosine-3',5'-bis(diphosphate) 3'-pyrophosphohydrolase
MTDAALILQAADRAAQAHAGQTRKGGQVPYVNHVIEVARLVAEDGRSAETVAAALLHDVVEDTALTLDDLAREFGPGIAALVGHLTDDPDWERRPRAERKRLQAAHIGTAPDAARAIKVADQTSNVRDVGRLPEGWAPGEGAAYVAETAQVVDACRDAAPRLARMYDAAVAEAEAVFAAAGRAR